VSGDIFNFGPGEAIIGAEIKILELPERSIISNDDGSWRFTDLPSGQEVSFIMLYPGFPEIQTGTILLGDEDVEKVTFQAPDQKMYDLLASTLDVRPEESKCQIASTVTRVGKSLYTSGGPHGEPGATVAIEPEVAFRYGPYYFNILNDSTIYPDPDLTETTEDGGVLFVNVDPREYILKAHKEGVAFTDVKIKCRRGVLVNASPPWGLQALSGGIGEEEE
jgi:hypothetical protein